MIGVIHVTSCSKLTKSLSRPPESNVHIVSDSVADLIAINFNAPIFFDEGNSGNHSPFKYTQRGMNKIKNRIIINDTYGIPAIYVYNFDNQGGFIFVSADYQMKPLQAFIERGEYKANAALPEGLNMWLNKTISNFELVRQGLYDNLKIAASAWKNYFILNGNYSITGNRLSTLSGPPPIPPDPCNPPSDPKSVSNGPLLPVTWGQKCTYNELCDLSHSYSCDTSSTCFNSRPMTGCAATSVAQIIRYFKFPVNAYGYTTMPNNSGDTAVQRLMSDIGVSENMNYGCNSTSYRYSVVPAIKNKFGFSSANYWAYGETDFDSYSEIEDNLITHNWPVIFQGQDFNYGAHQWVCDGCTETTYYICSGGVISENAILFHMNWGWHEVLSTGGNLDFNGWFNFDDWTIYGGAANNGNINYQYYNYAITEIHP